MQQPKILLETALLGQGLVDFNNQQLLALWQQQLTPEERGAIALVWFEQGQLCTGPLEEFLTYRGQANMARIDARMVAQDEVKSSSGFCTAAACLALAPKLKAKIVVTSGMGGVMGERLSSDLSAIAGKTAFLISAGFKDVIEWQPSLDFLATHGIKVMGYRADYYDGFCFQNQPVALDGQYQNETLEELKAKNCYVMFNQIAEDKKLADRDLIAAAKAESQRLANKTGRPFHPIFADAMSQLTQGQTAKLSLWQLLENTKLALMLAGKSK